ncbi:MAG: sugar ABC transporter permease, partial [Clostridia bacterium]|nr:sugar ABC transporter permease [Clostridia bacterium]
MREANMQIKKKKHMGIEKRRSLEAYLFLIPWIIGVCVFFARPIFISIRLAFSDITEFKGLKTAWVGLENFQYIFFYDINFIPTFLQVVYDTLLNTPI